MKPTKEKKAGEVRQSNEVEELKVGPVQQLAVKDDEVEKALSEPNRSKIETLHPNSLKSRWNLEKWSIIRELWRSRLGMIQFYTSSEGGELSLEEAIKLVDKDHRTVDEEIDRIVEWDVGSISWYALESIFRKDPSKAQEIWEEVKEQALEDFKSGHFAAQLFERTEWQKDVWKRAHFVVVYQGMVDDWKPRGAIEHSMVEMLAISFFLYHYWIGEHMQRATTEPRRESWYYREWRRKEVDIWEPQSKQREKIGGQWTKGEWDIPYQREADAIAFAAEMADRFRREYQAQLRQMRDWRRYSVPVTINNPQQVNIAADGGQQVNVQAKKGGKKKPRRIRQNLKPTNVG